jgi:hypothetical protein
MDFKFFVAKNIWYILIAISTISVVNLPIQVLQLIMISHLAFPGVTIPIPWYVFMFGGLALMLGILILIGIVLVKTGYIKIQNRLNIDNSPQICEILERLDAIEKQTKPNNNGFARRRRLSRAGQK